MGTDTLIRWRTTAALMALSAPAAWGGAPDLQIQKVMPEGLQVPAQARQIVVTFDRPVKPLGVMAVDQPPATITPALACQWHWLDPRSLACELNEKDALAPATQYSITVHDGIRTQDGGELARAYQWTFSTERPAVKQYTFYSWRSPGTPVVRLVFNQAVTEDSVQGHVHFGRQASVIVSPDPYDSMSHRAWLVEPTTALPADTTTQLRVTPGIKSPRGDLPGSEQRTLVEFDTFPSFRFLGIRCLVNAKSVLIDKTPSSAKRPACDPLGAVWLVFSSPVIAPEIKSHLQLTPDLTAGRTDFDPWENVWPSSSLHSPHGRGTEYSVQLPEHLRAFQNYSIVSLQGTRDEFGRPLTDRNAMDFQTDHRPPRLKTTHPIAVLEQDAPTQMPVYVTNLTDIDIHYSRLTAKTFEGGLMVNQSIARAWDTSYAAPLDVRDLLDGGSGVVSGSLHAHPNLASGESYFDSEEDEDAPWSQVARHEHKFFAEVTPYAVHAKLGAYSTLVWVTSLAKGTPVANARVRIYRDSYQGLTAATPVLAEGITDADGTAVLPGREELESTPRADSKTATPLMVRIDANSALALLPLDSAFEIDTYRASRGQFWSGFGSRQTHVRAWGTTAQGVYKLGDVIQYKLYLRHENNSTLEPVTQRGGYQIDIIDPTGKVVKTENDIALSAFGAYDGTFRVPLSGAVGWYDFRVQSDTGRDAATLVPMRVLVADFTPAPFQVQTTLNGQLFHPGDAVEVSTQASLHAGGPYASAGSRITARLFPQPLEISNPIAAGFSFAGSEPRGTCQYRGLPDVETVHQSDAQVDDKGALLTRFQLPDVDMLSARLEVESAVRDERGKYVASRGSAQFKGRDRFVGLRSERWTFEEGKPSAVQYLVVDESGKPVSGVPVKVAVNGEVVMAARVKGAGDAYLTSYESRWDRDAACSGQSGDAPQNCAFTPSHPGLYSIAASVTDTHGRSHSTELCVWVTGKGRMLWQEPPDMSLSLIAEKETYQVGERARYLVKNPFPGARALITIERLGVIKHWVQTLEGNTPVIEFPIEPDFLPGFYLSVVVTSPRVAPVPAGPLMDKDGVDLGRPTYRIGYTQVTVTDPYKALDIAIKSDKKTYKPRDVVKIEMTAAPHEKTARQEPVEFAVAVLDEAVFDLIQGGKSYFDPYQGFYQLDNLDLINYSLLSRLVGLQKFEKKGANSGGDGGAGFDMRNISKYVAYWNPSVAANKRGKAAVSFALPDNLTGWRVFAIAVTPTDRVGLGDYKFQSSKLTELRPVLPNQLMVGDTFTAGFSVLNRATMTRTLDISIEARGPIDSGGDSRTVRSHQSLTLAPFERDTVWLPLRTVADGNLTIAAFASDGIDKDALAQTVTVHKRVSLDVAASYGSTVAPQVDESLEFPAQMLPNAGTVSVSLAASVIGNLDGALRYVRDYPYLCWEQRLTKALLASNYLKLRDYLAADLKWPEANALPQGMLDEASSFQAPNGGMAFWVGEDARVSPYLSAATALAFNRLTAAGYPVPENVQSNLDGYLDRLLRDNVAPTFYSEGMVSSVRAVALQAMAERDRLSLADLLRYEKFIPQMDLFGLAAYLNASVRIHGASGLSTVLAKQILSHANQSGGQLQFSETLDDGYRQILATPLRSECAILSALLRYGETPDGARWLADVPFKLVRSITQARGSRDHWENTQENLYCTSALADYSAIYEKDTPALDVHVSLDSSRIGGAKFAARRDAAVVVSRPNAAEAGRHATVHIERSGEGRLYYAARLSYAPSDFAATESNAGVEVHREYSVQRAGKWQMLASPLVVKRGELVRIDLYISVAAARHFVVVDDPVPGGFEPVDRDLATASTVDADATAFSPSGGSFWFKYSDWSSYGIELWSFYHRELRHDAARFYSDYLPAGHYHLSYGAQAMAEGEFTAAPTKAEEMYDPDVYGKALPAKVTVTHE